MKKSKKLCPKYQIYGSKKTLVSEISINTLYERGMEHIYSTFGASNIPFDW